jgi:5-methylcytosine-specific restriction endonuclease McrA
VFGVSRGGHWIRARKREAIIRRDDGVCVYCGSDDRLGLDHLTPTSRGGTNDASNLVTACHACNSSKKGLTLSEFVADPARVREIRNHAKRRLTRILRAIKFEEALHEALHVALRSRPIDEECAF